MIRLLRLTALSFALCGSLVGCQGMGMQSAREQAMTMLSDSVKAEVQSYLTDVDEVTLLLKNVNSFQSALDTAPKLAPYISKLDSDFNTLQSYDADTLKNVREAFSPELLSAAEGLTDELNRMADSAGFGKVLKPVLESVKLFK